MTIIPNAQRDLHHFPGLTHRTLASHRDGLGGLEVWRHTLEPGGASPVHYHDCEEVVVILSGSGRVKMNDRVVAFRDDCTIIIPAREVHQLVNDGDRPMELIAIFSATPAKVFAVEGQEMALPWG